MAKSKKSIKKNNYKILSIVIICLTLLTYFIYKKAYTTPSVSLLSSERKVTGDLEKVSTIIADIGLCDENSDSCTTSFTSYPGDAVKVAVELWNFSTGPADLQVKIPIFDYAPNLTYISGSTNNGEWVRWGNDIVWDGQIPCNTPTPPCNASNSEPTNIWIIITSNVVGGYEITATITEDGQNPFAIGPTYLTVDNWQADLSISQSQVFLLGKNNEKTLSTIVTNDGPHGAVAKIQWTFRGTIESIQELKKPCGGIYQITNNTVMWNPGLGCTIEPGGSQEARLIVNTNSNFISTAIVSSTNSNDPDSSNNSSVIDVE